MIQLLFEHRIHHKDAGLMLYALQIASGNLKRMDAEKAKPTQVVVDPEKTGETPLGMTPWSASGRGHDPEDSCQASAPSPFGSGQAKGSPQEKPEWNAGDDAEGNEGQFVATQVSNAARAGAPGYGESAGRGAWSEMSEAERDSIRHAVDAYMPEDFEFRAPFWYLKKEPGQPLCPKCFAKQFVVKMGEAGKGCEPGYRRCPDCKWTAEEVRGDGGEVVSDSGVVQ